MKQSFSGGIFLAFGCGVIFTIHRSSIILALGSPAIEKPWVLVSDPSVTKCPHFLSYEPGIIMYTFLLNFPGLLRQMI